MLLLLHLLYLHLILRCATHSATHLGLGSLQELEHLGWVGGILIRVQRREIHRLKGQIEVLLILPGHHHVGSPLLLIVMAAQTRRALMHSQITFARVACATCAFSCSPV